MRSPVIDPPLKAFWRENRIKPNPVCDDSHFLRRIMLDLAGRIPSPEEFSSFMANPDREGMIDRLLEQDSFPQHWADLWAAMLNGYGNEHGSDRESLRLWLVDQFAANRTYDEIVFRLVAATGISSRNGAVNFLARYPEDAGVKVSRLFLGVQIDCARCHDHPYDRWTEDDFAYFSRFFDSVERKGRGANNMEISNRLLDGEKPKFLTGSSPRTRMWRDELALFMQHTRAFSKNFVNRIWYQLNGLGIVHSPDNFHEKNPPSVPALLDSLTEFGKESGWNFRDVIREVCRSEAYQRSSVSRSNEDQTLPRKSFAVRSIKAMSAEQWYRSISLLTDNALPVSREEFLEETFRRQNDEDFAETWRYRESVQQMMKKMALDLPIGYRTTEEAYIAILSRRMTGEDHKLCAGHSVNDVVFALLNSSEFFFNH